MKQPPVTFFLMLQLRWAVLRNRPLKTLKIVEKLMNINTTAFEDAVNQLAAKQHADEAAEAAAIQQAKDSVDAAQAVVDLETAKVLALVNDTTNNAPAAPAGAPAA